MKEIVDRDSYKPVLLKHVEKDLKELHKRSGLQVVDRYEEMLEEVFLMRNPRFRFDKNYKAEYQEFLNKHVGKKQLDQMGAWFYFPWIHTVVHFLPDSMHQELRTGRNKNLITPEEQELFYNASVAVLGMSVGSHVALTIAMTGGAKHIKLADLDTIGGSNLNRIRTGYQNIGIKKAVAVARQIYEINPYSVIEVYRDGVTEKNIERIIKGTRKLDLVVEEMDNPYFKMRVRELARAEGIPVIMAADHQDSAVVDVERFDKNKKSALLHGLFGKNAKAEDFKSIAPADIPKVISKFAGAQYSSLRMLESVGEVGKTLYSWPQLGTAASLCGSVLAQLARRILVKENIRSGRYDINLERFFFTLSKGDVKKKLDVLKILGIK